MVIGGGISGLSAAYELQQRGLRVTLIERDQRVGGKISTTRTADLLIEAGPDSFVAQKPWAADLARELGLGDDLIGTTAAGTSLVRGGRLHVLAHSMPLGIPTDRAALLRTPLLSPAGRLRAALEPWIPARRSTADESLADFWRRRFGSEALARLGEPLMSGIHSADAERQSMQSTFVRFATLEQQHGSLMHAMCGSVARQGTTAPFLTLRRGMGSLTDALAARLAGVIKTGCGARQLANTEHGYRMICDDGSQIEADGVIIAVPPQAAGALLAGIAPGVMRALAAFRSVSTAIVTLAYARRALRVPLTGSGYIAPRVERRPINAVTYSSQKFAGRAPEDIVLLRCFAGGARNPAILDLSDTRLIEAAQQEIWELLGIGGAALLQRVDRWVDSNPQYDVGHLERIAQIEAQLPRGVWLVGGAYGGVGIPDCVRQGRAAAAAAAAAA